MDTATTTAATPTAGWFSDPHLPETLRWWDGASWTHHVHPPAQPAAPVQSYAPAAQAYAPAAHAYAPAAQSYAPVAQSYAPVAQSYDATGQPYSGLIQSAPSTGSLMEANPKSMVAIGFSVGYLLLALTSGILLLGVVPALFTVRAFNGKEKLAPLALLATVIAMGVSISLLKHR